MSVSGSFVLSALLVVSHVSAFAPRPFSPSVVTTMAPSSLNMVEPSTAMEFSQMLMNQSPGSEVASFLDQTSNLLSFSDQGQNLAGIFFQASLLPYLLFLYFLSFRANRINNIGNFGFQFILLFVLSTIPSGIISKLTYGTSLANVDWLHGGAELLLTVANVLIVRLSFSSINVCKKSSFCHVPNI